MNYYGSYWWSNPFSYIEGDTSEKVALKAELQKSINQTKVALKSQPIINKRLSSHRTRANLK